MIEKEIIKSLMGESKLGSSALNSMLNEIRDRIDAAEKVLLDLRKRSNDEKNDIQFMSNQYQNILKWADEYDWADLDEKKMILAHLIERIEVRRDYHITIKFYIALDNFVQYASAAKTHIKEAENTYYSMAL